MSHLPFNIFEHVRSRKCVLIDGNTWLGRGYCDMVPKQKQENLPKMVLPKTNNTLTIFNFEGENSILPKVSQILIAVPYNGDFYELNVPVKYSNNQTFTFDLDLILWQIITKENYEALELSIKTIDWSKIKVPTGSRDYDVFEDLSREILIHNLKEIYNPEFLPKGADGGRDGLYHSLFEPFPTIQAKIKVILQCKYSRDIRINLGLTEVYDDMVKAQQYDPKFLIFSTNRNVTVSVRDAVNKLNDNKRFTFETHFVTRDILEGFIRKSNDLWNRYFGI